MPTEAAEDGLIVEDFVHVLRKVLNFNQEQSFDFNDRQSCRSFTDSEELEREYKEKLE